MTSSRRIRFAVPLLAAALAAGLPQGAAAQDWAGRGRAQGTVTDEEGNPIAGAQITLRLGRDPSQGPEVLYTDRKGRWSFLGLTHGPWEVLIDAEGYLPAQGPYNVNEFGAAPPLEVELRKSPNAAINRGDRLLDEGDPAAARDAYREAIQELEQREPSAAARLRSRIGDTYLQQGDYAKAREEYLEAIPYIAAEEQAHIRLQLAITYEQSGDRANARKELGAALPLLGPEGQAEVLKTQARLWDAEGNRDKAIETLQRALALQPENVELLQLTADLLTRAGREEEAMEVMARMPAGTKLPADMILNIGIKAYNDGNMDRALEQFDRAVQENDELAETYYYRGLVYLGKGENDKARADLLKLLELAPAGPRAEEAKEFLAFLEPSE